MTGCSSDEDDVPSIRLGNVNKSGTFSFEDDIVAVNFYLTDSKGEQRSVFQYDEDIVFKLTIFNKTEDYIDIGATPVPLLGNDVFRVYSENGKDLGTSWFYKNFYFIEYVIHPQTTYTYACSWLQSDHMVYTYPFNIRETEPLASGNYYSRFDLHFPHKSVTCEIGFKISEE